MCQSHSGTFRKSQRTGKRLMQLTPQECDEKIQDLNNQLQRLIGYKQALLEMDEEKEKVEIKESEPRE